MGYVLGINSRPRLKLLGVTGDRVGSTAARGVPELRLV